MLYPYVRPLAFLLPPEAAHDAAMLALRLGRPFLPLFAPWLRHDDPAQAVDVLGIRFPNRVGLAAGFDKAAQAVDAWEHLGFGHAEIGTVTRLGQPGNPKPRAWRYPAQQALINRFGFNNPGADAVAGRLQRLSARGRWPQAPVGINLGKSKLTPPEAAAEDYAYSARALAPYADYLAINVSSPNTPGLRALQAGDAIAPIVSAVAAQCAAVANRARGRAAAKLPLFVKFAPDMEAEDLLASVDAALAAGADGLILTNTTLSREGLPEGAHPDGGLSGGPVAAKADAALSAVARHTQGRVPLIGVGGVFTVEDCRRKMELGAVLVQIYTGFIYGGPGIAARLNRGA